tara:strand:+ start:1920 stop:3719 length:1800 start_codon:yes stop_codon:yes gene_type:complete
MRIAHWLRPNAKTELPTNLVFVDTETKPVQVADNREAHSLWFGEACHVRIQEQRGREYRTESYFHFENPLDFWDWIAYLNREGSKLYIFAHNWNFDGAILRTASILREIGYDTLQYINGKPPFILRLKRDKRFLALIDTLNYFQSSLDKLGESIGIDKLEMPCYSDSMEKWTEYCRRDVDVIKTAVLNLRDFVEANDLGSFRPTLASQAMNAFRHRFYEGGILIHDDEKTLELERSGYFGGRVECFQLGKVRKKLHYLDVNSLYPFIMSEKQFPMQLKRSTRKMTLEALGELLKSYAVVARVSLSTDEPVYPTRDTGRLVFPVGEFQTTLNTPELAYALRNNHIVEIHHASVYEQGYLFAPFVNALYALRQGYEKADNPAFAYLCKILMNSLYGKFGQRGSLWEEIEYNGEPPGDEWLEEDFQTGKVYRYRIRLGNVQRLSREAEARESFPAIAAHVTAYARMLMWRLILQAGEGHIFYSDTDSLIVDNVGYKNLEPFIHQTKLGSLKVESEANVAVFYGPKDYRFGTVEKHKGIKKNAQQVAENIWQQIQFHSWDWHLQNTEDGIIYIDTITKTLQREYKKGDVQSDGRVKPFTRHFE